MSLVVECSIGINMASLETLLISQCMYIIYVYLSTNDMLYTRQNKHFGQAHARVCEDIGICLPKQWKQIVEKVLGSLVLGNG